MRVLIVSEDAMERTRASSALALRGDVDVVMADCAAAAHDRALDGGIDVIVMDGDLSPEGGYSVLYEIRAAGELHGEPTPPAVVMAGRPQDRWLSTWAGAAGMVVKPVDSFELARVVAELAGAAPAPTAPVDESAVEVAAAVEAELAPRVPGGESGA